MTNTYFQTAKLSLPHCLCPLTAIKSPTHCYVTIDSLAVALAYDLQNIAIPTVLLKLNGVVVKCLDYNLLVQLLEILPAEAIRAKALRNSLIIEGLQSFINPKTGEFVNPLTGETFQLVKLDGHWHFNSPQICNLLGISESDLNDSRYEIIERGGR